MESFYAPSSIWAQVNYQYGASVDNAIEKLQYDLFYIQNLSFLLDLRIILKTIRVVLFGIGVRGWGIGEFRDLGIEEL